MKAIRDRVKKNIISLLKNGHSIRQISARVGVSRSTVSRIRRTCLKDYKYPLLKGRPRVLSVHQERNLVRNVLSGQWSNSVKANYFLNADYGINLSCRSVQLALRRNGLSSYIKRKKPFLKKIHRQKRLAFARKYKKWTSTEWQKIIWS